MSKRLQRSLWKCPQCKRRFANRNQSHFCGKHDLETHFRRKRKEIRDIYEAVLRAIRRCGPATVLPEKTRIAFQVRMSFAQLTARSKWVDGHVVLARRLEQPRFRKVQTISLRNHVHHFRLMSAKEVDEQVVSWLEEAYAVGEQRHLTQPPHRVCARKSKPARRSTR
jgi:hypothetical protein